ncbi:MAG: hypothetical protein KA981_11630 [Bacteroidia bacterium]|nr:hypothetical protein [Bacteroidia bacterium]
MTANELRIGNWLLSAKTGEPFQVDSIPNDSEITAQPIVLSPDILEKCGFKKNKNGEPCIEINDIASHLELMVGKENYFYPSITQTPDMDEERTVWLNRINSLHQLQNLYFALTGEELNILL